MKKDPMVRICTSRKKIYATLEIDTTDWSAEQHDKLYQAENLLGQLGIKFDTGTSGTTRDWELDWSLKGAELWEQEDYSRDDDD